MRHPGFEGLLTGHTLAERYHVEEVIGRGGFAAVYRATDQRLGRTVALKVITHSGGGEVRDEIQRRFQREARAIASLHHPNVVTVYDFGTDPVLGLDFLVMELLQGEVLSERLRRPEPLPVAEALRILLDAAAGVDAGHRAGLVHRDIKPGNIFLAHGDPRGGIRVYVLDFGIARFTEPDATQLTHSGRGFLSPAYASPEQLRGERKVTPAADVFSLGVIGYQMLAREKPFPRDRLHLRADAAGVVPLRERNPQVPPAVAEAIHRAMADDPAGRFPDAGAFARALMHAQAAPVAPVEPVAAAPEPPPAEAAAAPIVVAPPELEPVHAEPAAPSVAAADESPSPAPSAASADEPPAPAAAEPPADRVVSTAAAPLLGSLRVPAPSPDDTRRERPRERERGVSVRAGRARRVSPALLAIPLLLVLGLVAWLVAGRGRTRTTVAERDAPAADDPRSHTPTAAPAGNPASPTTGGTAASPSTPSASPSPAPAVSSPASPTRPAVPASAPISGARPRPSSPPPAGGRPAVPLPPPGAAPARTAAATAEPPAASALNRQGEALFERGDMAGAVARFRQAVARAPGNAYYRNNLGWALFQLGQVDEAGRELAEAVRLDPRRDIAYANIGEVERVKGNTAAAIAAYERFLQLNTDPRREQIAREKLRRLRGG